MSPDTLPCEDMKPEDLLVEENRLPDIVVHGIVTPADVDKLFKL